MSVKTNRLGLSATTVTKIWASGVTKRLPGGLANHQAPGPSIEIQEKAARPPRVSGAHGGIRRSRQQGRLDHHPTRGLEQGLDASIYLLDIARRCLLLVGADRGQGAAVRQGCVAPSSDQASWFNLTHRPSQLQAHRCSTPRASSSDETVMVAPTQTRRTCGVFRPLNNRWSSWTAWQHKGQLGPGERLIAGDREQGGRVLSTPF